MSSQKVALIVVLMIGVLFAFSPSDYIYRNETASGITYSNFTYSGSMYSIVSFASTPTFMLKDGNMVTNQTDIATVLKSYYLQTYYPSDDEMNSMRALVKQFNDSRNNGYDFKNKEEYVCRDDVLLSNGKISISGAPVRCADNASCQKVAMILYSVYGEGLNLGGPAVLLQPVEDFTLSSIAMDSILANYTSMLNSMDESNVYSTINYIHNTTDKLKSYSLKIESTIFRTPRLNDSADLKDCTGKCYAICPSMDLDQNALNTLKNVTGALLTKVAPISNYNSISSNIYSSTQARLEYKETESEASKYLEGFAPYNRSANLTITLAESVLKHVSNTTLRARTDHLEALHSSIPASIGARNFTTLSADISDYQSLISSVNASATELQAVYDSAKSAKTDADALIYVMETKDIDPTTADKLLEIENATQALDASFHDGITESELMALNASYGQQILQAQDLSESEKDVPASRAVLLFRGFAREVNTGIANVAANTDVIKVQDIPSNQATTLGLFSVLVFLSFASLIVMAFLFLVASTRRDSSKIRHVLVVAFVVAIVYLMGMSLFLYLFLGKTSTDATFTEYRADLDSRNTTAVVLDLRNVSFSDSQQMQTCASKLYGTLAGMNKTVTLYTLNPGNCNVSANGIASSSSAVDQCITDAGASPSSFVLGYSSDNAPPKFSIIYQNQAQISGNADYYSSCPLVALFS